MIVNEHRPYNPLSTEKHYNLDGIRGQLRVIQDGSEAVILLVTDSGEQIVLNIVEYRE